MNKIDLKDRIAIITGGAQGFGLAIVKQLLASDSKIIIWDKDEALMESLNLGNNVKTLKVDITNFRDVETATKESIKIFGGIDILVNNAGIAGPSYKTWEYPLEDWKTIMDIDLRGVLYC